MPSLCARGLLAVGLLVLAAACLVRADVYMHSMRGGNNRLNEQGQGRANGDRLWDSQNNNRGGYNVGSVQRIYYFEGTVVPIEWTQQHSCGDLSGNNCEIILQYTCGDKWVRDGTTTNTIPIEPEECEETDGNCDQMKDYGRHESLASYQACKYRSRNRGLFLANQRMNGQSARFTRQNRNGGRSGLECPEERDYYPYWHPTIWRDAAIITNRPERCLAFQQESQNVKPRYYCQWDPSQPEIAKYIEEEREGWVPITQAECEDAENFPGGKWVRVESWGLPQPECVKAAFTRDNHLGNAMPADPDAATAGYPNYFNWTVPSEISAHCVFRLRYNISTGEFPNQGFKDAYSVQASELDSRYNMVPLNRNDHDKNARFPSQLPIWETYRLTYADVNGSFTRRVQQDDPDDDDNGGRLGGIRKAQPPSRDYTLRNNPQVDIFGSLLPRNQSSMPEYYGQPMIRLRLAIDTAQYGRTFEDRSHVFEIRRRPANLKNVKIHNLSVRGKRGNIVQVYPGVEYDFVPEQLRVSQGDMVHIQWTGSMPSDSEGQGDRGDRNNLVLMAPRAYTEHGQESNAVQPHGHYGRNYPALINDTSQYPTFLGLDFIKLRMLALYGINSSHFDLGPVQALTPGEYRYMCTRNNAFSNRSQKGLLIVDANATWAALPDNERLLQTPASVSETGETWTASKSARLMQAYYDGTLVVPGSVSIADDQDGWLKVNPPVPDLGVGQDMLWLEAERPMAQNFFYKGKVEWKQNADDEPQELVLASSFYAPENKLSVVDGGYYRSTSVPNTALIAGVSLGIIGLVGIFTFLYWKVRVQPEGGWKAWWEARQNKQAGGGDFQSVHDSHEMALMSPGQASSSPQPQSA